MSFVIHRSWDSFRGTLADLSGNLSANLFPGTCSKALVHNREPFLGTFSGNLLSAYTRLVDAFVTGGLSGVTSIDKIDVHGVTVTNLSWLSRVTTVSDTIKIYETPNLEVSAPRLVPLSPRNERHEASVQ